MTHPLLIIAVIGVIILFGGSVYESFDNWIKTIFNGPEYCFRDITQSDISIAAQGASISYIKTKGDELCFRTKDPSIVERLNQQIQDRKLTVQLAEIEANRQFWNYVFPKLFFYGLIAFGVIVIIFYLINRDDRMYI